MAETVRTVQKIESRASLTSSTPDIEQPRKRVAAYARVSTDSEEQLSSYEAQVEFYTRYIKGNPGWEFVDVYTDEGISGTNIRKREGFNRMVSDALNGKIDLILTKSISRFARNTVDTLTTVRTLKDHKVEVYFEKENIYTLDTKGEVMLTIMGSLAQEESRSISENVTWGKRRSMEEGKFSLAYKHFLGYEKGENGLPKIVEHEAKIIREIYQLFLDGSTARSIADYLTLRQIPTPRGRKKWSTSTIMSILQNEKYKGDALLQKTYTADFLTKKVKKNCGEVPQYYIENSHPAIIDAETFDLVQKEIERRKPHRYQLHRSSPLNAKIICGECGGFYGRKVWHSNSKYRKSVWQCNHKFDNESHCSTPNLNEDEIENAFVIAFNQMLDDKAEHLARLEALQKELSDTSSLDEQLKAATSEHARLLAELRRYMEENTRQIQDQTEYNRRFSEMDTACQKQEEIIAQLKKQLIDQHTRKEQAARFLRILTECCNPIKEFDTDFWSAMIENVTVSQDKTLSFRFYDGSVIDVKLPEKTETSQIPTNTK